MKLTETEDYGAVPLVRHLDGGGNHDGQRQARGGPQR